MPTHPIGEKRMTSGERSARSELKKRLDLHQTRVIMTDSANALLQAGRALAAADPNADRKLVNECFRNAEVLARQVDNINFKLAPYEKQIEQADYIPRKGFELPDPTLTVVMTDEDKQKIYEKRRELWRPSIKARYGHLAKAESKEG
jgi:hypothetical protein